MKKFAKYLMRAIILFCSFSAFLLDYVLESFVLFIININYLLRKEKKVGCRISPVPGTPVLALGGDPTSGAV